MYQINIAGRCGKDAETRNTTSGDKVTTFSVATDVRKGREKVTKWTTCVMWGERGEALAQYLVKGTVVAVSGQLDVREYEQNGDKRFSVECRVNDVTLLGGGKREDHSQAEREESRRAVRDTLRTDTDSEIPF